MLKKLPVPLPPGDEYYASEQWRYPRPWARIWLGAGLISASLLAACVGTAPRLPNDNDTVDNVPQPASQPAAASSPPANPGPGTPPSGPGNPPGVAGPGDVGPPEPPGTGIEIPVP